jgi:Ca2+:H+ antiporter
MDLQQQQAPHPNTFPPASRDGTQSYGIEKVAPTNQPRGFDNSTDSEGTTGEKQIEVSVLATPSSPDEKKGIRQRIFLKFGKQNTQEQSDGADVDRVETSKSTKRKKQNFTFMGQIRATILSSPINLLLFAVPVGIIANYIHLPAVAVFVINFVGIVPLAAMLSFATEEIALRVGETLGGLLNATFGYLGPSL